MKIQVNIRLPKDNKQYWLNQLQLFAKQFDGSDIQFVAYGKQDLRGVPSITLFDSRHCVPVQKHFATAKELLAYVAGYNEPAFHDVWKYYTKAA